MSNTAALDRRAETRAFVDAASARLPLAEVLRQDGVRLTRQGRTFRGPCPIHAGRNPNFVVLPGGDRYFCHKCGASGDLIDYLQHRARNPINSFPSALAWLSEATGIALPRGEADAGMSAETRLDVARHPVALDFAVRFYQAVRDARRAEFDAGCAELGVSAALAEACGAGLTLAGDKLAANVMRQCAPDAWAAFHRLGLVDQRFDGPTTDGVLVDRVPAGQLVWPLLDRGRLAGLAVLDRDGNRTYCTEPGRTVDPRFAVLAAPDAPVTWCAGDADPSVQQTDDVATVWRDARAFWDHAHRVPGPHVVPAWRWGTAQDAPRVRTQLVGREARGVVRTDDDIAWWARGPLLEWVDAVIDGRSDAVMTVHPLELAVTATPGFDAALAIAEVASPLRQMVMRGWFAQIARQAADPVATLPSTPGAELGTRNCEEVAA